MLIANCDFVWKKRIVNSFCGDAELVFFDRWFHLDINSHKKPSLHLSGMVLVFSHSNGTFDIIFRDRDFGRRYTIKGIGDNGDVLKCENGSYGIQLLLDFLDIDNGIPIFRSQATISTYSGKNGEMLWNLFRDKLFE